MNERIPEKLKQLREHYGYTKAEVAGKLGISVSEYAKIETGENRCKPSNLIELSILYDVPVSDLRDDSKDLKPGKQKRRSSSVVKVLLIAFVCMAVLGGALFGGYKLLSSPKKQEAPVSANTVTDRTEPEEVSGQYDSLIQLWKTNKAINSDYQGQFFFDSGLIDLPVVQGNTNDTYLRTDWQTMEEDSAGSVFMDYRNNSEDQNLILYGHYVYAFKDETRTKMFTPLEQLLDEKNYKENRYVNLLLEGELRRYEIADVYYCDLYEDSGYWYTNEKLEYYWTNFSADYFETYKEYVKLADQYSTGVDYTMDDHLLTLQTCVENHDELREIVICKEIERIELDFGINE